ncbi:MAG: CvpA family protein [Bacillota bacterium]|nr:CvpA family protein [Bacillota bacterium]
MWVDILIAAVFVASTVQGYRRGFMDTFIHTAGWLLAVVLGFVWHSRAADFLMRNTDIYQTIYTGVLNRVNDVTGADDPRDGLPAILRDSVDSLLDTLSSSLATGLSNLLFNVVAFLAVVLACKLALWLLSLLIGKKRNDGLAGFVDGILGLLAGVLRGVVLVYLVLALMVPILGISESSFLREGLESSAIALSLYDNNPIFLIVKDIL